MITISERSVDADQKQLAVDAINGFRPTGEIGRNGGPIGFMRNGDKVEMLEAEDEGDEGKPGDWPLLLQRNEEDILKAFFEFRDKVRESVKKNPRGDDFDSGLLWGRVSALNWVLGDEWEDSLDL